MRMDVYSLRDKKADVFGRPVFVVNVGLLIRELSDALEGTDTLARHPEDFALYKLGAFDDVKGTFDLLPLPDFVLEVASLARPIGPAGREAAGSALAVDHG